MKKTLVTQAARALGLSILTSLFAAGSSGPTWAEPDEPGPDGCGWYGKKPVCYGECEPGWVFTGKVDACTFGSVRRYCCPAQYKTPGNCHWDGNPGNIVWICDDPHDDPHIKFTITNACPFMLKVEADFVPVDGSDWVTNRYRFSRHESGYLFDTATRYVYVAARALSFSSFQWPRAEVDLGSDLGGEFIYELTCQ
jgi:hypothetical protein